MMSSFHCADNFYAESSMPDHLFCHLIPINTTPRFANPQRLPESTCESVRSGSCLLLSTNRREIIRERQRSYYLMKTWILCTWSQTLFPGSSHGLCIDNDCKRIHIGGCLLSSVWVSECRGYRYPRFLLNRGCLYYEEDYTPSRML